MALANLSPYHLDFGKTPQEHAELKQRREAGEVPFVDKEVLRAQRSRLLGRWGR